MQLHSSRMLLDNDSDEGFDSESHAMSIIPAWEYHYFVGRTFLIQGGKYVLKDTPLGYEFFDA